MSFKAKIKQTELSHNYKEKVYLGKSLFCYND